MDIFKVFAEQTPVVDIFSLLASVILSVVSIGIAISDSKRNKREIARNERESQKIREEKENDKKKKSTIGEMGETSVNIERLNKEIEKRNEHQERIEEFYKDLIEFGEKNKDSVNILGKYSSKDDCKNCGIDETVSREYFGKQQSVIDEFYSLRETDDGLFREYKEINKVTENTIYSAFMNSGVLNYIQSQLLFELKKQYEKASLNCNAAIKWFEENQKAGKEIYVADMLKVTVQNGENMKVVNQLYNELNQAIFLFRVSLGLDPKEARKTEKN